MMEQLVTQEKLREILIAAHNMAIEAAIVVIERQQLEDAKRLLKKVRALKK